MTMTKAELIEHLVSRAGIPRSQAAVAVESLLDSVVDALKDGEKVELRRFGSFRTRERSPRRGRNPKTGEPVDVPAKRVAFFKPGKHLRTQLDDGDE